MVAGVRRASEPQHRPRCLARSRRSRRPGGASVGRAIVRGQCGKPESTVASFRRVVMFDLQHGAKSCGAGSLALCCMAIELMLQLATGYRIRVRGHFVQNEAGGGEREGCAR